MQIPLAVSKAPAASRPTSMSFQLRCHGPDDASRTAVQNFVARIYARHFDARITAWAPTLVSLERDGEILAAAGYRSGAHVLFLERYLGQPVENAIASRCGAIVAREQIVEIGHLASSRAGISRHLMRELAEHLQQLGFRWAAITATRELRVIFKRLRVHSIALAPAMPSALGTRAAALWGRYYAHAPQVIAGDLERNVERLRAAVDR